VDTLAVLQDVRSLGFRRALSMVDIHNLYPEDQPFRFWLAPRAFYRGKEQQILAARALLGDDTSRDCFDRVVSFRVTGDYAMLPPPRPAEQYCPADLPQWSNPLRFVDCGAFDGDTVAALARAGYDFEAIAVFEPDPDNFVKLARQVSEYGPGFCFPCGVGRSVQMMRFEGGVGMAGRFAAEGSTYVQCVALDQAIGRFRPTLVKMDIEGAEPEALEGARDIIRSARPALAIAVYHQPYHLWEIPLQVAALGLGYRLELRCHGCNSFDTVLYALPDG
jgi:FkbM family methyltransferase